MFYASLCCTPSPCDQLLFRKMLSWIVQGNPKPHKRGARWLFNKNAATSLILLCFSQITLRFLTTDMDPFIFCLCFTISRKNTFEIAKKKKSGCYMQTWWAFTDAWKNIFLLHDASRWYLLSRLLTNDCQISPCTDMASHLIILLFKLLETKAKKKLNMKSRYFFIFLYLRSVFGSALCFYSVDVVARNLMTTNNSCDHLNLTLKFSGGKKIFS